MDYFQDEWGGQDEWGDFGTSEPVQAPQQTSKPVQAPIGQPMAKTKAQPQPTVGDTSNQVKDSHSGFTFERFGDDCWDDNDLGGAMSAPYTNIMQDSAPIMQEKSPQKQAVQETFKTEKEEVEEDVPPAVVEEKPVEVEEAPKQAKVAPARNVISGSSVGKWGEHNVQNFAQTTVKQTSNRKRNNRNRDRKAPMKNTQSAAPGPVPSKHQVVTDPSSVSTDDVIQQLMDKIRLLETKVQELENRPYQHSRSQTNLGVCTLNSTGKVNHASLVVWDSTNHIIKPSKGVLKLLENRTQLEVAHRGLYQITFTTCGKDPQLIINGHVYAATRTAPVDSRNSVQSSTCVNIYLYLDEKARISGKVAHPEGQIPPVEKANPCEHWLCVNLVHHGF